MTPRSGRRHPRCPHCKAPLSFWEPVDRCGCRGPLRGSHPEVLYAVAASVPGPLHVRDYVRLADAMFDHPVSQASANATLSADPRFCWAGQGIYALYRHGPLPGPRSLEPAARLILCSAPTALTLDAIDFCLKSLHYRYNPASLSNAVGRSGNIRWQADGRFDHLRGEAAQRNLRADIGMVPPRRRADWEALHDRLRRQVSRSLRDRSRRLRDLDDPTRFGLVWEATE